MSNTIKASCKKCGGHISYSVSEYGGKVVPCPHCQQKLRLPSKGAKPKENTSCEGDRAHREKMDAHAPPDLTPYTCPHCQNQCAVPSELVGSDVNCPNCSNAFNATIAPRSNATAAQTRTSFHNQCPQCASTEIQRAAMGYMAGISQISGIGVGTSTQGGIGVGGFGGTQQTALSEYLRPPSKKATIKIVLITWIVVTIGFALYSCIQRDASPAGLLAAPIIVPLLYGNFEEGEKSLFHFVVTAPTVIAIIFALVNAEWNRKEHPKLLERYSKTWFCQRCGYAWLA